MVLKKLDRTISAETMKSVMAFAPVDGFALDNDMLNETYSVIAVNETKFGKNKGFVVTLESKDGKVINLSSGILKRSRVLGKSDVEGEKPFNEENDHVFLREDAEDIWRQSRYFHTVGERMREDEEFVLPSLLKLKFAILAQDRETEKPALNPFLYKGYRQVVNDYSNRDEFPTLDDFKAELLKTPAEGRIAKLPVGLTELKPFDYVKLDDVKNFRSTLIFEDFEDFED